jgi:hypothetical protein
MPAEETLTRCVVDTLARLAIWLKAPIPKPEVSQDEIAL